MSRKTKSRQLNQSIHSWESRFSSILLVPAKEVCKHFWRLLVARNQAPHHCQPLPPMPNQLLPLMVRGKIRSNALNHKHRRKNGARLLPALTFHIIHCTFHHLVDMHIRQLNLFCSSKIKQKEFCYCRQKPCKRNQMENSAHTLSVSKQPGQRNCQEMKGVQHSNQHTKGGRQ